VTPELRSAFCVCLWGVSGSRFGGVGLARFVGSAGRWWWGLFQLFGLLVGSSAVALGGVWGVVLAWLVGAAGRLRLGPAPALRWAGGLCCCGPLGGLGCFCLLSCLRFF